ncbi:PAS domain-containing sensor histidine kinase [Nocardioides marmotae]|uniref:PAS domain-containing sensor histidine kinase n=1 Tax=Nocardioides marmotae TaxID=2663857 RepID=UPI0012B60FDB|nr:ATP-binding protein [Nocardioides marmotae]MBC9734975.1 PAS domain S-box protein [Nocardioides marmotae]MTB86075.1 PAS domain S-box protein [Nocardioides marmotae]
MRANRRTIGGGRTTAVLAGTSVGGHALAAYLWWRLRRARAAAGDLDATRRGAAETGERYRSLFRYHPSAVFSLDLEGRFVEANPAAAAVSGYPAEQLIGMEFARLVAPSQVPLLDAAFHEIVQRRSQQLETVVARPDGSEVEVSVTGVPIVVDGEVVGVYGIAEDITARNRLQRELTRTRRSAEQASEAKSVFLANVSHEIRTPLTAVMATTELLLDSGLDPEQTRFAAAVQRSSQRLLRLVDDILDLSSIEAGRATVHHVDLDLRAVVSDAVALLRPVAEDRGLTLSLDLDPDLPRHLTGDAQRLAQVVTNLLDNAVKFTPEGSIRVGVEVAETLPTTTKVIVRVEDTGIGVTEEQQARLFQSFSQGDPSITRRYGGTGLGLAICKQLVALMGGSIWMSSTPGGGSTFAFAVPLGRPDPEELPAG